MVSLLLLIFGFILFSEILLWSIQDEPIPGDILLWKDKKYKVILWEGFDYYDLHLENEEGQITKVDLHEIQDARITGLGVVRIFRYFREVTGI